MIVAEDILNSVPVLHQSAKSPTVAEGLSAVLNISPGGSQFNREHLIDTVRRSIVSQSWMSSPRKHYDRNNNKRFPFTDVSTHNFLQHEVPLYIIAKKQGIFFELTNGSSPRGTALKCF